MRHLTVVCVALLLHALGSTAVYAQGSGVLVEVTGQGPAGQNGSNLAAPAGMTFCLGYEFQSWNFANPLGSPPLDVAVGCDQAFADGTMDAWVVYNAANTPDWAVFVATITDGVDDLLHHCDASLTAMNSLAFPTSCGAGNESGILGTSPDLTGFVIDEVRLHVDFVDVSQTCYPLSSWCENDADWHYTFEIVGRPATDGLFERLIGQVDPLTGDLDPHPAPAGNGVHQNVISNTNRLANLQAHAMDAYAFFLAGDYTASLDSLAFILGKVDGRNDDWFVGPEADAVKATVNEIMDAVCGYTDPQNPPAKCQ